MVPSHSCSSLPPYTDTVIEISKVQYLKTAPLHSTFTDLCPPQKKKKKKKKKNDARYGIFDIYWTSQDPILSDK